MQTSQLTGSTEPRLMLMGLANESRMSLAVYQAAQLIDVVAGYRPTQLETQLELLWGSSLKEAARYALAGALACRDPLSHPDTTCTDGLNTLAALGKLIQREPRLGLSTTLDSGSCHACALLNACDDRLARLSTEKQTPFKAIRNGLRVAARLERKKRGAEIRMLARLRDSRCPEMWQLYERYCETK